MTLEAFGVFVPVWGALVALAIFALWAIDEHFH